MCIRSKSEAFASGIEQIAGLRAEYGVSAIWCLEFISVTTEINSKEIPAQAFTSKIKGTGKILVFKFEFLPTLCKMKGKRVWFSGRTPPCQGGVAVSITATRTTGLL